MVEKQYPIRTVDGQVLENDKDLDQWFSGWHEKHAVVYYNDFSLVGRWSYIFDNKVDEWIMRYNLLKNNNIPSYSNLFDGLPAIWVEALTLINQQINMAMKEKSDGN